MTGELEVGKPRIGVFWCRSVPGSHPAMVHDTGSAIELVFMFDRGTELARMAIGTTVRWGDNPGYQDHDYALPDVAWFADAHGHLCLVDPLGRRISTGLGSEGRIRFRFAVQTGYEGVTYAKIHALRSRIEGLEQWMAISSVSHEYQPGAPDGVTDVITLRRQEPVIFSRRLNATLRPSYIFKDSPVAGQRVINDEVHVHTHATTPHGWSEHLELHRTIRDLLVVAGWERNGIRSLEVRRNNDPVRALARNVLGQRWAPVSTYAIDRPNDKTARERFLFVYDDIGARGLRRWVHLRNTYRRGIAGMIHSVNRLDVALETAISDIGAALESIGYTIAAESSIKPGQKLREHLRRIAAEIDGDLDFNLDQWCLRLADVYNSVKHPDRPDPDSLLLLNTIRESQLVFRVWIARRLSVPRATIARSLRILPMNRPYERM